MIFLYVKTHNKTGLKYLGKTIQDPNKYKGSGLYWTRHIKEHGYDVTTEVIFSTDCPKEFSEYASSYSKKHNIVESDSWANFREETGHGGFSKEDALKGYENSLKNFTKDKLSEMGKKGYQKALSHLNHSKNGKKGGLMNKGKPKSEAHKEALRETWRRKKIEGETMVGKTNGESSCS